MRRAHRITLIVALFVLAACQSKAEIRKARRSAYDTDFAIVYSEALAAVRELYPDLAEDPTRGLISTAWHQITFSSTQEDERNRNPAMGTTGQPNSTLGMPRQGKRTFVRFDISVSDERPHRVKVYGKASEWE